MERTIMRRVHHQENTETIYVEAHGDGLKVFAMPYRLPVGQMPWAIHPTYQNTWKKVAELDENKAFVNLNADYQLYLKEEYLIPGMYFEVSRPCKLPHLRPGPGITL
jgi:hypothetical protein